MSTSPQTAGTSTATGEHVVLVDDDGAALGLADKRTVHGADTPLHLAFSCYLFDGAGSTLMTRRAADKATFPGVLTNTVCGHPASGERLEDSVRRRAKDELGLDLAEVRLVLPRFRYLAEMNGVREHELCPVLTAHLDVRPQVRPAPGEVDETGWLPWRELVDSVRSGRRTVSPWCAEQIPLLDALGPDPHAWPAGVPSLLPVALRP